jgi:hypothetical protein
LRYVDDIHPPHTRLNDIAVLMRSLHPYQWPGYFADTVTIPLTEALTRGKLALLVCRAFASYFQKAAGMACDRRCAHMRIGVGANGIKNVTVQSVEFSSSMKAWYPKFNIS